MSDRQPTRHFCWRDSLPPLNPPQPFPPLSSTQLSSSTSSSLFPSPLFPSSPSPLPFPPSFSLLLLYLSPISEAQTAEPPQLENRQTSAHLCPESGGPQWRSGPFPAAPQTSTCTQVGKRAISRDLRLILGGCGWVQEFGVPEGRLQVLSCQQVQGSSTEKRLEEEHVLAGPVGPLLGCPVSFLTSCGDQRQPLTFGSVYQAPTRAPNQDKRF